MKIKGYIRPLLDENISSWLVRCAESKFCSKIKWSDISGIFHSQEVSLDSVLLVVSDIICRNSQSSLLDLVQFAILDHNSSVDSVFNWRYFCPECVLADDKAGRGIAWRKHWNRIYSACCFQHKRPLLTVSGQDFLAARWQALVVSSAGGFPGARTVREQIRNRLGVKVQRSMLSMESGEGLASRAGFFRMLYIYSWFLRVKSTSAEGVARSALIKDGYVSLGEERSCLNAMLMGVRNSSPLQRLAALLIVGVVFDFFSSKEVEWLKVDMRRRGVVWPQILEPYDEDNSFEAVIARSLYRKEVDEKNDLAAKEFYSLLWQK
ncbi:hypothetical protein ACQCLI_09460 [Pseudomonas nitroreducens]|uniref:hypothetical protein n=1 Tax=Pseudomonas nitroreducens TaxID=46680 RepID=UPI00190F7B40|nr:hypothetical protein [Pseudomonas nitroreducens]